MASTLPPVQSPPSEIDPVMPAGSPTSPAPAASPEEITRKSPDERKEALGRAIHTQVAQGARVESQGDYQAVLVRGHRPNNMLHLFLTIVTFGLWLFVWLGLAAFGGEKRTSTSVDEWGNTNIQNL
jgi:hypothetical protein